MQIRTITLGLEQAEPTQRINLTRMGFKTEIKEFHQIGD